MLPKTPDELVVRSEREKRTMSVETPATRSLEAARLSDLPTTPADPAPPSTGPSGTSRALRWLLPVVVGTAIHQLPQPDGLEPGGWALLAIFVATIAGIIAKPAPMGVVCILGLSVTAGLGVLTPEDSLSGFSNPAIWLIVLAFFIARGFIKTGLGTRIAYRFVQLLGRRTVGLAYGLAATDLVLAPAIPSNTARAGGVVFPILRSLSSAFESEPNDESAKRVGSYLTTTAMQVNAVTSGMFVTAMAANPIVVDLASQGNVRISWGMWALAAIVPGLVCIGILPLLIARLNPPEVRETPGATEMARSELVSLGAMARNEKVMLATFVLLLGLWTMGDQLLGLNATVSALIGLSVLLVTGVLTWDDVKGEKGAWDTLVWFAVLVTMAKYLSELGVIGWFSGLMGGVVDGLGWPVALTLLVVVYVYVHYFFASNTAHVTAMYAAFLGAALAVGAPPVLAALSLGVASNLMGALTHYSSGPAPVLFGAGYTSIATWWRVGLVSSLVTLSVFGTVGVAWTRVLGLW